MKRSGELTGIKGVFYMTAIISEIVGFRGAFGSMGDPAALVLFVACLGFLAIATATGQLDLQRQSG